MSTLEWWMAWRQLRSRRGERFISLITWLSVGGVAVGLCALIVVFSVMTGYKETLREKLQGVNAHIAVYRLTGPIANVEGTIGRIKAMPGVVDATPVVTGQSMFAHGSQTAGAVLRGVDQHNEYWLKAIGDMVIQGAVANLSDGAGVFLGVELAKKLGVEAGGVVRGTIPVNGTPKVFSFKVAGVFSSGMFEFDSKMAFTSLETARRVLELGDRAVNIDVRIDDMMQATEFARSIEKNLGSDYWVSDWKRMNHNMFYALELQRVVLSLILGLIVLVAAFNVAATLIMVVIKKTREIGILKAMGASNRTIRRIFALQGVLIGVIGSASGLVLGLFLCWLIGNFKIIKIPGDIYLFDRLPVDVSPGYCALFACVSVFLCWVATFYPSRQASRLNPIDAIRIE